MFLYAPIRLVEIIRSSAIMIFLKSSPEGGRPYFVLILIIWVAGRATAEEEEKAR